VIIYISLIIITAAVLLSFISLIKGKSLSEKMVALDVITTIVSGLLLIISFLTDSSFVLDIAIIYAILSFGAVIVVARYYEGGF
jgi:multicomponent Na+:H+ antiporter subunit F